MICVGLSPGVSSLMMPSLSLSLWWLRSPYILSKISLNRMQDNNPHSSILLSMFLWVQEIWQGGDHVAQPCTVEPLRAPIHTEAPLCGLGALSVTSLGTWYVIEPQPTFSILKPRFVTCVLSIFFCSNSNNVGYSSCFLSHTSLKKNQTLGLINMVTGSTPTQFCYQANYPYLTFKSWPHPTHVTWKAL